MAQQLNSTKRCQGIVAKFNDERGFGFIRCSDGSGDIFVHRSEIYAKRNELRVLRRGQSVEFEVVAQHDGRRKAVNVTGVHGTWIAHHDHDHHGNNETTHRVHKVNGCGTPMEVYQRLKASGNKPWTLSLTDLQSVRMKNRLIVYLRGIPLDECKEDKLKRIYQRFGCVATRVSENQRKQQNYDSHHGGAYLLFADEKNANKARQFANAYRYRDQRWPITANYGLDIYCRTWLKEQKGVISGRHNMHQCVNRDIFGNMRHKWAKHLKEIHTTEDTRAFNQRRDYGARAQPHYSHRLYNGPKAPTDF